jgi:hypothetical protein
MRIYQGYTTAHGVSREEGASGNSFFLLRRVSNTGVRIDWASKARSRVWLERIGQVTTE